MVEPICCVAEIPIQHLNFHAEKYGKFALGFFREGLLKKKFRPVFYCLKEEDFVTPSFFKLFEFWHDPELEKVMGDSYMAKYLKWRDIMGPIFSQVKTFYKNEFDSVYCEREWRCWGNFKFDEKDTAFIICPEIYRNKTLGKLKNTYKNVPVISFESLIEN